MVSRRPLLLASIATLGLTPYASNAQSKAAATEASVREAAAAYVLAWNSHDLQAWNNKLTEDIWYTEAIDYYQRSKGRAAVNAFFGETVKTSDIAWQVTRVKLMPDGTATMVVMHSALILPKKAGKYASSFESNPSVARWRIEDGQWKLFYFTTHKGTALDAMKKDGVE
jgi:ketosteroid isomerase-like protein